MTNLTIINQNGQLLVESRQVAEMVERQHNELMKSIRQYCEYLTQGNFALSEFFIESTYQDSTNRTLPCYLLTRKACDMVANKMTGEKGVLFTATYVTRFEEMEQELTRPQQLTRMQILEIAMAAEKQVVELQTTIADQKPKVVFAESVECSKDTVLVKGLATILNQNGVDIGQNRLFVWLRDNGYLSKRQGKTFNAPTQKSLDLKIMQEKTTTINRPDREPIVTQTPLITGKGQLYFVNKFLSKEVQAL
jgi:Rha family phage regulatory protein